PDGHPGQDGLDEIRRLLRHAPPAATGADRAALAGQGYEALERTVVAPEPQKAMDEQSAPEEGAELALDEAGQPDPVGVRSGRGEEGLQMLPDHSVQDRIGGGAWDIGSHGAAPSGFRAGAPAVPRDWRTADARRSRCRRATPSQPSVALTRHRNR